jgi:chromosome partitioning protein
MRSVLVTSMKGGCGKTTLATNLAAAWASFGLRTGLAELDRQKSAAGWLAARPGSAAAIHGLDWRRDVGDVSVRLERLVMDAPAGMRMNRLEGLLDLVDTVLVPVAASPYDEASTRRFVARLVELRQMRKGRCRLLLVGNRLRPRSRAARRHDEFMGELAQPVAARLSDRAVYADLAARGLGLFDVHSPAAKAARTEWPPLLQSLDREAASPL